MTYPVDYILKYSASQLRIEAGLRELMNINDVCEGRSNQCRRRRSADTSELILATHNRVLLGYGGNIPKATVLESWTICKTNCKQWLAYCCLVHLPLEKI